MKRRLLLSLILCINLLLSAGAVAGQRGGGHTVYGDFKIDESKVSGLKPETFHLVLYNSNGYPVSRQMITNNGRYRFFDLANGEYYIAIEVESEEVTRIFLRLAERDKTDIRRDIALEWHASGGGGARKDGVTVSAGDMYTRSSSNKALWEKAEDSIKKKDYEQAVSLLKEIIKSDPKDFVVWTELGTIYFKKENLDEAENSYQQALRERPAFLLALLNLGKLRLAKKDFEGAIEPLDQAVKAEPLSADANFFLGEAYLQIKKGSKAVGYLDEALRLDPVGKADAHLRLAALYKGAGLKEKAVVEYEKFLAKRPDYRDKEKIQQYIKENKKP